MCEKCGYCLAFLLQIYANLDYDEHSELHRMLYVFACLSEKCIGTQNAIKAFRVMVPQENGYVAFAEEKVFEEVRWLSENDLIVRQLVKPQEEEKEEEESIQEEGDCSGSGKQGINEKYIELEEFLIETSPEDSETTDFYLA